MKKLIALTIVALCAAGGQDLMAATAKKKKKVKRSTTTNTQATTAKKSAVSQDVSTEQAAVTEANLPKAGAKKSPLSVKYAADLSTSKTAKDAFEPNKVNGFGLTQIFSSSYALTASDSLTLEGHLVTDRTDTTKVDGTSEKVSETNPERAFIRYTRASVLNEETHGIDVTPFIDFRYLMDDGYRAGADGIIRPAISFSKTFGKLSTNVTLLHAQYYKHKDSQKNGHYNYVTFGPSYQVSDSFSLSLLGEYIKVYSEDGEVIDETTDFAVSANYVFTPKFNADIYLDSNRTMVPGDAGDLFNKGFEKQVNIGASFNFKVL